MWVKLNSTLFRWENSVRANQISHASIFHAQDNDFTILKRGIKLIGYCEAHKLAAMPVDEGYAIMLEFSDGEEYWTHNLEKVKESN